MSTLYMVRHGQASFGQANYDRLSELGEQQMRLLGEYWLKGGLSIDAAYCGLLERQQKSGSCVAEKFVAAGKKFPAACPLHEFDEYETRHLLTGSLAAVIRDNPEIAQLVKEISAAGPVDLVNNKKNFQKIFSRAMAMWVDEKLKLPGMESWREFTGRVGRGIEKVMREQGPGKNVAVFTSGGPVSAAMQKALGLADLTALELGWVIMNGSVSEFRYSGEKFSLVSFNAVPHLREPALISYR